jgi:hypothetical protein
MRTPAGRRGFVLLTVLLCLLLIAMLALTAASLAVLARRTSASALSIARTDALVEGNPLVDSLPIPATPGQTLILAAPAPPGWASTWQVTRLGGELLLVRSTAELTGPGGVAVARSALSRLLLAPDSSPPTPLPGGWLGTP